MTVDGTDLATVDPAALPTIAAYAFERPVLFGGTVGDALADGDLPADARAVADALPAADAADFVDRLPGGLDTPLDALRVSGGELQRLGLARAFSRRPRLLVLDDALSGVDTLTERRITAALTRQRVTRLIVTTRVSTAREADIVVWLHEGRIMAVGPHETLESDPGYRALFGTGLLTGTTP
ncbi:ATP-binding cassette domain-containing protein [Actinophytocola sp. KF-1]